jgi:8-oxo-dGTP pyrophosphatase MutT (NUDIX family)
MSATEVPLLNPWLHSHKSELDASKNWLVGVAIFRKAQPMELLVVKRAPTEEAFPNNWELPGGHVEDTDLDVYHTIERETAEETGQIVEKVLGEFEELFWDSRSGKKNIQMNYAVTVKENIPIKLNPDEHSEWMWATAEQCMELLMTPAMRKVLSDSFRFAEKYIPS